MNLSHFRRHRNPRSICLPALLLAVAGLLSQVAGCAVMKLPLFETEQHVKADAQNPVAQVTCIWQPAEGRGLDEMPGRGFAGQIVFLTASSPTPVEVEGDVTIYLFDDHGTPEERSRPLHVFRFVDGSWQTHMITTAWGPTYQLFIPYVRKGSHRASCSLAVQIETPEGRRVTSEMASIVLRGSDLLDGGVASRYAPRHSRLPAGRVIQGGPGMAGTSPVVPASAQLRLSSAGGAAPEAKPQTPKFESFSIPYDFHQANGQ